MKSHQELYDDIKSILDVENYTHIYWVKFSGFDENLVVGFALNRHNIIHMYRAGTYNLDEGARKVADDVKIEQARINYINHLGNGFKTWFTEQIA